MIEERTYAEAFDDMEKAVQRFRRILRTSGFPNIPRVRFTECTDSADGLYVYTQWGAKTADWEAPPYVLQCSPDAAVLLYRGWPIKYDTDRAVDFLDMVSTKIDDVLEGETFIDDAAKDVLLNTLGYRPFTADEANTYVGARVLCGDSTDSVVFKGVKQGKVLLWDKDAHENTCEKLRTTPPTKSVNEHVVQLTLEEALETLRFAASGVPFGKKWF